jgi:hypothetical protein
MDSSSSVAMQNRHSLQSKIRNFDETKAPSKTDCSIVDNENLNRSSSGRKSDGMTLQQSLDVRKGICTKHPLEFCKHKWNFHGESREVCLIQNEHGLQYHIFDRIISTTTSHPLPPVENMTTEQTVKYYVHNAHFELPDEKIELMLDRNYHA